jgi:EpsD family peptidyl-prolyl cis-trans isomerase
MTGAAALALVVGMTACGGGGKHGTQVVAKVDDSEITVLQLNRLLHEAGADPSAEASVRLALDSLIDQDLLLQQAKKIKIDRDPDVVQAIEAARRQIIADAYARRMIYPQTPVTAEEEETYYNAHPDLFAKRKVYELEVFIVASEQVDDALKKALDGAATPAAVAELLKQRDIKYEQQSSVKAAEQVPLELLAQFAAAKPGDSFIVRPDATHATLMQLKDAVEKPLTLEQAKPYIYQFLVSSRNRVAMNDRVKDLRAKAHIEYLGKFAEKPAPAPAAEVATDAAAGSEQLHLQQGLSGLR